MAKQVLNVGSIKNDGTGDSLRDGAKKINDNFTELYNALGATTGQLSLVSRLTAGDGITVSSPSGAVIVTANIASTTKLGSIIVGENLTIDNDGVLSANAGGYTLPVAQRGTLGGIKVGDSLTITETGVVDVIEDFYTLPTATSQVLGGIKVGARLTITNGVLSADVQPLPTATTSVKGGVIVDGLTIGINGSGVISVLSAGSSLRNGDVTFTLDSSGVLHLPAGGYIADSTGTNILDGLGAGANTGDFAFSGNVAYNSVSPDQGLYIAPGGESTSYLYTPGNSQSVGTAVQLANTSAGGINLLSGGTIWQFRSSGVLQNEYSYTKTSMSQILTTAPTVVWTASEDFISGVKLMIQVESFEDGDNTGWHSQVCEAIIASRGYANSYGGPGGTPVMTVYGVTYTSTVPLVTFTVQRNPTTKMIEVVGTFTAAVNPTSADLRIYSVETATRD